MNNVNEKLTQWCKDQSKQALGQGYSQEFRDHELDNYSGS